MLFPDIDPITLSPEERRTQLQVIAFDRRLVEIVDDFTFLGPLSWPKATMQTFLKGVKKNKPKLPVVDYPKLDMSEKIVLLETLINEMMAGQEHPVITFLMNTATSYLYAFRLLQGMGTSDVAEFSRGLYGSPKDVPEGYSKRSVDIASYFLRIIRKYTHTIPEEPLIYSATQFRQALHKKIIAVINPKADPIRILIEPALSSRASAGPNYVKLRKGARFSKMDLEQLFHHEVMTHALTSINGRKQPTLTILGRTAPRVTATQEGLAVFSEYLNQAIDLVRLKRIALRVKAINLVEKGADFIDVFKFFKEQGQNDEESYYSAMRVFRGSHPKGGIPFYKDNVYLTGLLEVMGYLKQVMREGRLYGNGILLCGKLAVKDIPLLVPYVEQGLITAPTYLPYWAEQPGSLAAHLVCNDLTETLGVTNLGATG